MKKYTFLAIFSLFLAFATAQNEENAFIIQIASFGNPEYADFKKIHNLGYLYEQPAPNGLSRIMLGTFATSSTANQRLAQVKTQGYKDAFIQKIAIEDQDAVYIVQLATVDLDDEINWSDWKSLAGNNLVAQISEQKVRLALGTFKTEEEAEIAYKKIQPRAPKDIFIKRVSAKVVHKVTPFEMSRSRNYQPNSQVSRSSVLNMQNFLAKENFYKQKSDGLWGKTTESSFLQYQQNNQSYQNYQLLSEKMRFGQIIEDYSLQYYINLIGTKPFTADEGLKQFKHPLAKVYRAYMYMNGDVKIADFQQVSDKLMREAAQQIMGNYKQKTRSDFSFAYSYREPEQLIQHLREMHEASKDEPAFPCWLFQRHPDICAKVFAPYWNNERDNYQISSDCGSFFSMPSMRILLAVGRDMEENLLDKCKWSELNNCYAQPQPPTSEQIQQLNAWDGKIWSNLSKWADSGSNIQQRLYKSLYISYFDALRNLEDYFIKQGFSPTEARALGLNVVKTALEPALKDFAN